MIPVIDISDPSPQTAQQLLSAASTHGFLFIKNDGATIAPTHIASMFTLVRLPPSPSTLFFLISCQSARYFQQPASQKAAFAIHSSKAGGINRGWVRMQGEALDPSGQQKGDPKEAFNISPPHPDLQPLPEPLSSCSSDILFFLESCHALCARIFALLGTALDIDAAAGGETWFSSRHDETQGPSGTIFRMLYYPPTVMRPADGNESVRAGAHSDYGSLTLLFRLPGQPGLEMQKPDGTWVPVPVNPSPGTLDYPPILVNIGDLLSFWTNGMLKSTMHRVTFSGGEERYSMAYFCHPLDHVRLEPVPSRVIAQFGDGGVRELEAQRERLALDMERGGDVLTAKQHLDRRLKVTYGLKD